MTISVANKALSDNMVEIRKIRNADSKGMVLDKFKVDPQIKQTI